MGSVARAKMSRSSNCSTTMRSPSSTGGERWKDTPLRSRSGIIAVAPNLPSVSETFIQAHIERLPAQVVLVHGWPPRLGKYVVLSWPRRVLHKAWRIVSGTETDSATLAYATVFRRYRPSAVLAEYGTAGVGVMAACRRAGIPLIVHFHGYDASLREVLIENAKTYPVLFDVAAAIVVVSRAMEQKLTALGAPAGKLRYNPYGVDCGEFAGANPAEAPATFLAVGRLTAKKAPQVTLEAFAKAQRRLPLATLRMIGDGPMMTECRHLVRALGIEHAVTLLGAQPPAVVREEMRSARCFVQHSVEAPSGDSEGTPVAILEAGATGLPVVATRHAGIPDVVIEGETGFLVDEHDVDGMAQCMLRVGEDPALASRLGEAGRARIEQCFSMERSIGELWRIIQSCVANDNGKLNGRP
jgi:colanic acid/amylovoran biosynthesis glycosyltransferase